MLPGVVASGIQMKSEDETIVDASSPVFIVLATVAVALWVMLSLWTYQDARSRKMHAIFWLFMVLIFNIIGIIVYLILQKNKPYPEEYYAADAIPLAVPLDRNMRFHQRGSPYDYESDEYIYEEQGGGESDYERHRWEEEHRIREMESAHRKDEQGPENTGYGNDINHEGQENEADHKKNGQENTHVEQGEETTHEENGQEDTHVGQEQETDHEEREHESHAEESDEEPYTI